MAKLQLNVGKSVVPKAEGTVPLSSTETMENRVLVLADKLSKDTELTAQIEQLSQAKRLTTRGPLLVMVDLQRVLGDTMLEMPRVGSRGGNNPDEYPLEGSKRFGSYYIDLFKHMELGAGHLHVIKQVNLCSKTETFGSADQEYKDMTPREREKRKQAAQNRYNYERGLFRDAFALAWALADLENFKGLLIETLSDEDGSITDEAKCFMIRDADTVKNPDDYMYFTASALIKLDIEKIKAGGGTMKALKAALKRGTPEEKTKAGDPLTVNTALPVFTTVENWLTKVVNSTATEAEVKKYLLAESGEHLLLSAYRLENALAGILGPRGSELRVKAAKLDNSDGEGAQANAA